MAISLLKSDFEFIGLVASHCDQRKLDIAIEESIQFDLKPLLCDFFFDVDEKWTDNDPKWVILIGGGNYTNCRENEVKILGLKKALTYLAYARYVLINSSDDTPNGLVTKDNNFSIPKPLKEIESVSTRYKNMGIISIEEARGYVCSEKDFTDFEDYDFNDCPDCDCENCDGKTKATGFGLRGQNISKKIY